MRKLLLLLLVIAVTITACQKDYYLDDLNDANAIIALQATTLADRAAEIAELNASNEVLSGDLAATRTLLSETAEALNVSEGTLQFIKDTANGFFQGVAMAAEDGLTDEEIDALQEGLDAALGLLGVDAETVGSIDALIDDLQAHVDTLEAELALAQAEIDRLKDELAKSDADVDEITAELEILQANYDELLANPIVEVKEVVRTVVQTITNTVTETVTAEPTFAEKLALAGFELVSYNDHNLIKFENDDFAANVKTVFGVDIHVADVEIVTVGEDTFKLVLWPDNGENTESEVINFAGVILLLQKLRGNADVAALEAEIARLEGLLATATESIRVLELADANDTSAATIADLMAQLGQVSSTLATTKADLMTAQDNSADEQTISNLNKQVEDLNMEIDSLNETIEQLKNDLAAATSGTATDTTTDQELSFEDQLSEFLINNDDWVENGDTLTKTLRGFNIVIEIVDHGAAVDAEVTIDNESTEFVSINRNNSFQDGKDRIDERLEILLSALESATVQDLVDAANAKGFGYIGNELVGGLTRHIWVVEPGTPLISIFVNTDGTLNRVELNDGANIYTDIDLALAAITALEPATVQDLRDAADDVFATFGLTGGTSPIDADTFLIYSWDRLDPVTQITINVNKDGSLLSVNVNHDGVDSNYTDIQEALNAINAITE